MVTNAQVIEKASPVGGAGWWARLMGDRDFVACWFMLQAATIMRVFLAYPLCLGIWLSRTDTTSGRPGMFIGLEHVAWAWADSGIGRAACREKGGTYVWLSVEGVSLK